MAAEEQLVLDGLTLNDVTFGLLELNAPPPRQRREWIGAADSEWQALSRNPLHENREITARIQVTPQATTDLAMDKIGQVIDKLRLASRTGDGIALTWTPAEGTRTVTFDVLAGEITDLPIDWASGWLSKAPTITVQMSAKPYWRGTETLTTTASSSTPFVTKEIAGVTGDVPALGRLIVTDTASQSRRHVEWGIEGQYYNAATSLLIASDDMVTSGFGGTQTTTIGAYDPNAAGNNSITVGVTTAITAAAGTGNLLHVGTFRVKARVQAVTTNVEVRLTWQAADGPLASNDWVQLNVGASSWEEIDLGSITVPVVLSGMQRWTGRVDARMTMGTDTLKLNYLELIPTLEGYGKARARASAAAGVVTGYDQFTGTTAAGTLNTRVAPAGDTWATSGDATDYAFTDDDPDLGDETVKRSTVSETNGRYAILGASTPTDVQVDVALYNGTTALPLGAGTTVDMGVIARWTDSSNYLRATFIRTRNGVTVAYDKTLEIRQVVAGVQTVLATATVPQSATSGTWYVVRLIVYANGRAVASLLNSTGTSVIASTEVTTTVLATAGALASGKSGIFDRHTASTTSVHRYYDNFAVSTPAAEPIVLYSGRNMQFRHDDTIRQDSTGTYTGTPPSYRGSRFLVPVGTSRVFVKARRTDVEAAADANVTDATQIQIGWTPRGVAVPR